MAFDLAERFQTPVIMLSDLDIGMNDWVVPRLQWNDGTRRTAVVCFAPKNSRRSEVPTIHAGEWNFGIAPRTLAGVHPKGAYFTRGSGHNKFGGYTEIPDEYQEVVDRLLLKHRSAAQHVPAPIIERRAGARDSG